MPSVTTLLQTIKRRRFHKHFRLVAAIACLTYFTCIIAVYIKVIDRVGWDVRTDLVPWLRHYADQGIVQGLSTDPSNYTPFYNYLLAIASLLTDHIDAVTIVKLISIAFIPLAAYYVYAITRHFRSHEIALAAALGLFAIPTVILNAPLWGQADIIYTSFLLATFNAILNRRSLIAMTFYGLAISIKLQAIFFSPFLLYLILQRRLPFWYLAILPLIYLLTIAPEGLMGRPWTELLTIYMTQANNFSQISMEAPNIIQLVEQYTFIPDNIVIVVATAMAVISGLMLSFLPLRTKLQNAEFDLKLLTLCLVIIPYVLPKMHERYFFPADIFSYILFIVKPSYWPLALGIQVSSVLAYGNYVFQREGATLGAAIMTIVVFFFVAQMTGALRYGLSTIRKLVQTRGAEL